jgi:predicted glycoside hydrolase/deacetylase ChbG (UPF0249 family)
MATWITLHGMISLIVNADDLGSNPDRDRGILQAFREGIVTSASLLANGQSFLAASAQVKELRLPVGVHLNLADGSALTGEIKGLTAADGTLPGKEQLRHCLAAGGCDPQAIRKELAAQIERLFAVGLQPDHLDSHQHCQLFPCLTGMMTDLALGYGIPAMRTALPQEPADQDPDGSLHAELALYRQLARQAHTTIRGAGLKTPDGLWGMPLLDQLDTGRLCTLLEDLPDGCWELMTHPGYPADSRRAFDGLQRQEELRALLSAKAFEIISRRHIRLCSFGEMSCAS